MKHKCDKCDSIAVWYYEPMEADYRYCDACVKRGCGCNINYKTQEEFRDEQGRLFPCCEYGYSEDGFEITSDQ
jgi:hypothetical protein